MSDISRITSSPFPQITEDATEIQPAADQPGSAADANPSAPVDEIEPFSSNTFESMLGLDQNQFATGDAIGGSATTGEVNASAGGASVQGQTDVSGHASYGIELDPDQGTFKANVDVGGTADAHYTGSYNGSATIDGHEVGIDATVTADVQGTAQGSGTVDVTLNDNGGKVDVQGQAFAGAQAGIEGNPEPVDLSRQCRVGLCDA